MAKRVWLGVAALMSLVPVGAQAQQASPWSLAGLVGTPSDLTINGSVRLRVEAIDGQPRTGFNDSDALVELRTIVFAEYHPGPFRFGVQLNDSRAWGGNAGSAVSTGEINAIEPVQAYIAVDFAHPFGKGSSASVQAGRLLLDLGSRRLVANDDYRNTTNGFTGLRADLATGDGVKATLVYVLPQQRLPDDRASLLANRVVLDRESFAAVLWGGVVSKAKAVGDSTAELAFYHFGERDSPRLRTRDRSLDSIDVRLFRQPAPGRWDHEVEAIYQTGRISDSLAAAAPVRSVRAWFAHARFGYTLAGGWKPHVSFEFDAASGDHGGAHNGRFDPLFGMRRGDFAPAGIYNAVGRSNVVSPGARVEVTPGKRTDAFLGYRLLWLESATDTFSTTGVRDAAGRSGDFAGHQFDARLRHWLVPGALRVEADGVVLLKGNQLRHAPNAPANGNTLYGSLNLVATF